MAEAVAKVARRVNEIVEGGKDYLGKFSSHLQVGISPPDGDKNLKSVK